MKGEKWVLTKIKTTKEKEFSAHFNRLS